MTIYDVFILLGGVGLFLYGMTVMSAGLKNAAGDNLQVILEHATKNKIISVLVGILITILVQSSSATDVMVIGFVNSGLMTLTQAIGIIMGANIGTTITAQITAFNLSSYAPLILFVGAVMYLFIKKNLLKSIGSVIMGFGMLFEGIALMKGAIAPLSQSEVFVTFLSTLSNPALAVLFGVAFTALVQSSSSSTVIFQAFAVQGLLSYDIAVYLVIGAAIGSVTPNLLASLTANRNGRRTAVLNLLFNLFRAGILIVIINLIPQLLGVIRSLSPDDIGRQIANTHTIFAITAVLLELPFTKYIVKLAQKIIPIKPEETRKLEDRKLLYMSDLRYENVPSTVAITQARHEICRMGEFAQLSLVQAFDSFFKLDDEKAEQVRELEDTVDFLNHAIEEHLVEYRTMNLSPRDIKRVSLMTLVASDIERLSDHAKEFAVFESHLKQNRATLSDVARKELRHMSELTMQAVALSMQIFRDDAQERCGEVQTMSERVSKLQDEYTQNHVKRLMASDCEPMGGVIFTDMLAGMERCAAHAENIACAFADVQ